MVTANPGVVAVSNFVPFGNTGLKVANIAESLFAKKKTVDNFKNNVWSKVPFSLRRIEGGKGKWHDTLTGASGNDQWGDVRAVAVVAGAIDSYVDANGILYDNATGVSLGHEQAWQRWVQAYGNVGFSTAYALDPSAFRVYGPNVENDPSIGYASPRASGGALGPAKDYVEGQIKTVVDTARQAADNIVGVGAGAVNGAVSGATRGANSAAYSQAITQSPLFWVGVGALVLIVLAVASKKRG